MMMSVTGHAPLESWEKHTQAGFRALSSGLWREARDAWLKSIDDLRTAETWDARTAAAMNNSGVACMLDARWADAEAYFDEARQAWAQAKAHLPELDVPIVGRSSAFHFRLATRHQEAFADSRRRRCAVLCAAAAAITDFNADLIRQSEEGSSPSSDSTSAVVRALVDAFGPRCPELKLIGDGATCLAAPAEAPAPGGVETNALYAEKAQRLFELQARSMAAAQSVDYRHLEMATNLTALLSPRLLRSCADNPSHLDGSEE